jgi:hypothetical protein
MFRGVMVVYGGTGSPFGLTTSNNVVACNLETGRVCRAQRSVCGLNDLFWIRPSDLDGFEIILKFCHFLIALSR